MQQWIITVILSRHRRRHHYFFEPCARQHMQKVQTSRSIICYEIFSLFWVTVNSKRWIHTNVLYMLPLPSLLSSSSLLFLLLFLWFVGEWTTSSRNSSTLSIPSWIFSVKNLWSADDQPRRHDPTENQTSRHSLTGHDWILDYTCSNMRFLI